MITSTTKIIVGILLVIYSIGILVTICYSIAVLGIASKVDDQMGIKTSFETKLKYFYHRIKYFILSWYGFYRLIQFSNYYFNMKTFK